MADPIFSLDSETQETQLSSYENDHSGTVNESQDFELVDSSQDLLTEELPQLEIASHQKDLKDSDSNKWSNNCNDDQDFFQIAQETENLSNEDLQDNFIKSSSENSSSYALKRPHSPAIEQPEKFSKLSSQDDVTISRNNKNCEADTNFDSSKGIIPETQESNTQNSVHIDSESIKSIQDFILQTTPSENQTKENNMNQICGNNGLTTDTQNSVDEEIANINWCQKGNERTDNFANELDHLDSQNTETQDEIQDLDINSQMPENKEDTARQTSSLILETENANEFKNELNTKTSCANLESKGSELDDQKRSDTEENTEAKETDFESEEKVPSVHSKNEQNALEISEHLNNKTMESIENGKIDKSTKSRLSVEVIYDTATKKPKSKELIEIDQEASMIVLDSSHETNDSKTSEKLKLDAINESVTCGLGNKGNKKLIKNSLEPLSDELTDLIKTNGNDHSINVENSLNSNTIQPNHNLKSANAVVVVSDSDNSLVDHEGNKNKSVFDTEQIKTCTVEKEISINIKLRCSFNIDESTKDVCQKEILSVTSEPCISSHLTSQQKNMDNSSACLADISETDNKDHSPASVNSNPQPYQLNSHRLSFISTVSSSSSASSAASLATKILNKEKLNPQFTIPQGVTKNTKKPAIENPEELLNWEACEKLAKEWKNGRLLIMEFINALNEELIKTDLLNGGVDDIKHDNIKNLKSSTPESKDELEKSSLKTVKKGRVLKRSRSSRNSKLENVLHNSVGKLGSNKKSKDVAVLITPSKKPRPFSSRVSNSSNVSETINDELIDAQVFAKWSDNNYYPGIVSSVNKNKYKVSFYDNKNKDLVRDFIVPIPQDMKGALVTAIDDQECELPGCVIDIKKKNKDTLYVIQTEEQEIEVEITNIFLTFEQAQDFKSQFAIKSEVGSAPVTPQHLSQVTLDNMVDGRTRSKRLGTPGVSTPKKCLLGAMNKSLDVNNKPSISGTQGKKLRGKSIPINDGKTSDSNLSNLENDDEEELLGIHISILGTSSVTDKSMGKKTKGKGKNQKKEDSPEIIDMLGPIPQQGSEIFKGKSFILSCTSPDKLDRYRYESVDSEPGTEYEEEWLKVPFVTERLEKQILAGGGCLFKDFDLIPADNYCNTMHITNAPNRTKTNLLCLSVGIRSYSHKWVIRSCKENAAIVPQEEFLPTGYSIEKQKYVDYYERKKEKPLETLVIAIPLECGDEFVTVWQNVCQNAGAVVIILEKEDQTFMEATALVTNKKCPTWVTIKANSYETPILSTVWVVQSLIEGNFISDFEKYKLDFSKS